MRHEARMPLEPALNSWMFMRAVVVHDDMQLQVAGELLVQSFKELQELLMPVSGVAMSDHLALRHLKCGKQSRGAISFVVVGHRSTAALLQGQPRLGTIQGLNLALFINAEHHRFIWRIEI